MMNKFLTISFLLWFLLLPEGGYGQACCSAGTPLLGSLELPSTPGGSLQFALSYDYNSLQDVVTGTMSLDEASRRRVTHSLLLETSYGLTSSISISSMLTLVQQERRVVSPVDGRESFLMLRGIGDAVLLVKYNVVPLNIFSQFELTIGGGAKIPIGAATRRANGILVPADMQPGTGAWDGILWVYGSKGFMPLPLNLFVTLSYRLTGTNHQYGEKGEGYRFGNELITSVGLGYRTDTMFDFSLAARLRHTSPDKFSGDNIPNTGGLWVQLIPGINAKVFTDLTFRVSGQLPVYRNLRGTQLTTSYTAQVTIFYTLEGITN